MSKLNRRLLSVVLAFMSSVFGLLVYWGPTFFGGHAATTESTVWFFSRVLGFSLLAAIPFVLLRRSIGIPIFGGAILGYILSMWYVMRAI